MVLQGRLQSLQLPRGVGELLLRQVAGDAQQLFSLR